MQHTEGLNEFHDYINMSQNSQKLKFQAYSNNPHRGHTDFGQAGYPQQYSYANTLSSVPSNSSHDMSKQVAAAQPGMFSNSGGMPTTAQHHQSGMGGPIPSPQSASLVQQGQQLSRGNMQMQVSGYYTGPRGSVPRSIPNLPRNPLTTVVNQTGQQPSSQYSHTVQMLPSTQFHPLQQMIVNHQFTPTMYQQRPYSPQYPIIPQQQLYVNNWNTNYSNPPQQSSNGYYPQHGISTFNAIQPQMPQPQPPAQQQTPRKSKAIAIINPTTGKSVFLDDSNDDSGPPLEKESENDDPNLAAEFAKQVALTLTNNRNEPSSKQQSVEDTSIVDPQSLVLCPVEVETAGLDETETRKLDEIEDPGELADTESLAEMEYIESHSILRSEEPSVILNKKDIDSSSISEYMYEKEICTSQNADSVPVTELRDPKMYDMVVSEELSRPDTDELVKTDIVQNPDSSSIAEKTLGFCEIQEVNNEQPAMESPTIKTIQDVFQPSSTQINLVKDESKIPELNNEPSEPIALAFSSSKTADKLSTEGKKNKAKKKKDINKRGESKEGGEMDAFLDTKQEDAPVSPVPPPVQTIPTPVERLPSPVPILDSEILSTIPLPGETFDNFPANDISPSEPTSETSSISPSAECEDKENAVEETPNKIVLKYSYKEDQWSPLNPEGKKQYDRNFLLQLQGQPMSLCKPNNLPNLDVIKDKAHIQRLTEVTRVVPPMIPQIRTYNDPFMPNFARGGAPRLPHPAVNRRSQQGRGGEKPRKVIAFTSSLTQNIKLHESENAWKPLNKIASSAEMNQDDLEREKLKRSVQGVLNKLTPQKFETLLTQLKNLNIDTEEKLKVVIDLIFEKAIDEPNFSVPYANLCKHLALIKVPICDKPGQQVNFRKLLLTKCQKEFEQDRINDIKHDERMKAMEEAEPEKRKEMKLEFDEEEKKMRYRQLGNIRFIGELFKLGMLIEPIMHECIKKLLSQGDEESLECLCRLLKTIGKELDEGKSSKNSREQNPMDLYFGQMLKFVDKRLTSSRVRFMLQDVIDLKKNNWVPRRDENMPKTIDQIHKEAEREAREQQQVLQNMSNYPKRPPDDRDRRKNTARNINQSEDGWTSSSKSNKGSYSQLDPTKLKLTKPDEVDSIRLGPGGRGLQSWGRGSSGGTKTPAEDVKTALTANRYSALSEQSLTSSNYEGRRGSQRSAASSRESSRGRSNQLPTTSRKTPSTSKEREELIETVKGLTRASETKVQDTKKNLDVQVNGKAPDSDELCLRGPEYSDDEMERKTKPLIDEFLHNNDYEEAIKCVTELASPSSVHMFINAAINQVLERSSQARYSLGKLLYSLLKKKILSFEQYKKGCGSVLEIIDDYALDIPLIWDYMGEILEPMIEDNEFPLTFLKEVLQPCIPSETAGLLVSAILHTAAKRKGTIKLGEFWRESAMQWTDFLGADINVNDFVQKHKLEFTISPTKVKPNIQMSIDDIKKNLLSLLENDIKSEEIFDWIDANVSENAEPNFVRALVSTVHENVISGSGEGCKLDGEKLKTRTRLLTRYIGHNENLELQALYAIQSLMNQLGQPNGLLHQIFNILYDDDVITEETFKAWESSDDPNEAEGKGVAVHSVKSFFTWLREADSGDEEADE